MNVGFVSHKKYVDQSSNYVKEKPIESGIADSFDSTAPINPHKLTLALKAFAFCGIKKPEEKQQLAHRLVQSVNHPVVGKVEHYEIYDPSNDVAESRQQVFLVEKKDTPVVTMGVNILTGSSNEHNGINGISHLLEHMIFKSIRNPNGTIKTKTKDLCAKLDSLGVDTNAWTSADNTLYMATCLKENFAEAMKVHSEMVLSPAIVSEELEKEKSVVVEEIGIARNSRSESIRNSFLTRYFSPNPYKFTVLGPKKNVLEMSREDIIAYHKNFYAPMNRQIFVIGNIQPEEALKEIKESYNKGKTTPVNIPEKPEPSTKTPKNTIIKSSQEIDQSQTYIGFPGPDGKNLKEVVAMQLIGILLSDLDKSCLKQLENKKRSTGILGTLAYPYQYKDANIFIVYSNQKYLKQEEAHEALAKSLADFAFKNVSQEELDKAKLKAEFEIVKEAEGLGGILSKLSDSLTLRSMADEQKIIETIRSLSVNDIQETAIKYLDPGKAKFYNVVPKKVPRKPKKKKVSFTGKLSPQDTKMKLDNGVELVVRRQLGNLMTSVTVLTKGGNRLDNFKAKIGLMSRLLNNGTTSKTPDELTNDIEKTAMDLEIKPETDALKITAASLTRKQEDMLKLLGEVISSPRFLSRSKQVQAEVEKALRKEKTGYKEDLVISDDDDDPISNQSIYDEKHPYSDNKDLVYKNVSKVQLADIRELYRKIFTPSNMVISVVGDVDPKQVKKILNESIGTLKERECKIPQVNPLEIPENQLRGVIDEGSKQAKISKVWKAPEVDAEDALAMRVLRLILCYTNTSRLFTEFRNKRKGLCYSVGARYSPFVDDGVFSFYVETNPKNVKKCLNLFDEIVEGLKTNKISESELEYAKKILKTSLHNAQTRTRTLSNDISEHRTYNSNSAEEIIAKLDKLTIDDVNRMVEKYLFKPNVTTVFADEEVLEKAGIEEVK